MVSMGEGVGRGNLLGVIYPIAKENALIIQHNTVNQRTVLGVISVNSFLFFIAWHPPCCLWFYLIINTIELSIILHK